MNGFVLFIMIFTSPPAAKTHPVWTLHSTAHFEFATMPACIKFGKHLQKQVDTTDTVTMRGWCVNQGTGTSTRAPPAPDGQTPPQPDEPFFEIPSERAQGRR